MADPQSLIDQLQQNYDIFSPDELKLLQDGGISVSDTEEINSESIGEIYDMGPVSEFKSPAPRRSGGAKGGLTQELLNKEREIMEERYKYEKNHVHLEMAHQKTHFMKRAGELEREVS